MAKRISACVLTVIMLCSCLASCSGRDSNVLTISGAQINREIFAYFLDEVAAKPSDYGLDDSAAANDLTQAAVELCTHYVAANTMFTQYGLSLTNAQKISISEDVNDIWVRYSNHYDKIGVSRSTISKIETAQTYEDTIFTFLFDKGTKDEDFEQEIKDYFAQNYIIFRAVCGYYTAADASGNDIEMTDVQKDALISSFNSLAKTINGGADIETAAQSAGYVVSSTILLSRTQAGYPDGFFDDVLALDNDTASVLSYSDCVFIVRKLDISKREEEYSNYRTACIKAIYSQAADKVFSAEESGYTVTQDEKEINSFCSNIEIYG